MNILCAGLSHQTTPLEVREKFAVSAHRMKKALDAVCALPHAEGAVIISTCNRVEIYTTTSGTDQAAEELRQLFRAQAGISAPWQFFAGADGVRHLFRVASGLDSMVVGETEILGQVKQAYRAAAEAGSTNRVLHKLFQHAFRVAKRVRTETHVTRGASSVAAVAVHLSEKIFGGLTGRQVMILGAGDTSERTARSLVSRGVKTVLVSNRSYDRAARLASEIGGVAVHFEEWQNAFAEVDILISSTAAPRAILTPDKLAPVMKLRQGRPLFIIDLAVPRDVDPAVREFPDVHLYDIDSLEAIVRQTLEIRRGEVIRCEQRIAEHVDVFMRWLHFPHPPRES